jgi:hypothetical protein
MSAINWAQDLDDACRQARNESKLVLLDFFSPR